MSKETPNPNLRKGPLGEVNRHLAACPPAYVPSIPVDLGQSALSSRISQLVTPKEEKPAYKSFSSPVVVYKFGERGSGTKSNGPPQDFYEIRKQCLNRGVLFEDPAFPANASSLGKLQNQTWKRPSEICEEPKFIEDGASRFDINQGVLGDCWFLAAIASITLNKDITRSILPMDQSFEKGEYAGIFHFRFWRLGRWIDVVVDDLLPMKYNRLMFLHSKSNKEFWGSLIEKAYAKVNGSYEYLSGGYTYEALEDFTGGLTEVIRISEKKDHTKLFKFMRKAYERSSLMGCSMEGSDTDRTPLGLIPGHAYSVTCVAEVKLNGDKVSLVRIRNPWGNEAEWEGKWRDGCTNWEQVSLSEKKRIGYNPGCDGEFWMSMTDFVNNFTMLEVCHLSPQALKLKEDDGRRKWEVSEFRGMWVRGVSAGGCNTHSAMYCQNPQYIFTVEDPDPDDNDDETESTVIVSLMQKSRRSMGQGTENLCIGFSIFRLQNPHQLPKPLPADYFFYNPPLVTPAYAYRRGVTHRENLTPGTYCVVPTVYEPNQEGEFLLRIFSEKYNDMKENDEEFEEKEVNPKIKEKIEEKSKGDDKILKKMFEDLAGTDGEVDWKGLKKMLDSVFEEELKGGVFSKDICRSMVAMMDADRSGKLDYDEFKKLCYDISNWMEAFHMVDKDHSGNLDITELKNAFSEAGFQLNKRILQMIVHRYAGSDGKLDFDDFIMCSVRLKGMLATFRDKDKANQNAATFSLGEWMETTMYS